MLEKIIIAHRGYHNDVIPENSMEAFKWCVENNIPIELDVHLLSDNKIVVFHDDNLIRMTGIDKVLESMKYEELKNIKLKNSNECIPLFTDVLNLVKGKVLLDIELKTNAKNHNLEDKLLEILKNYDGEYILKSFNYRSVKYLKKHTSHMVGLLYSNINNNKIKFNKTINFVKKNIDFNVLLKPDFIGCNKKCYKDRSIRSFKGPVLIWTIRNEKDYDTFANKNFGLISEYNLKKH